MPSVPSRLAAVFACAIAFGMTAPALADKDPGKDAPPPPVSGLQAPGSDNSSGGSSNSGTASPQAAPAPSNGGGVAQPHFTPKTKPGKSNGPQTIKNNSKQTSGYSPKVSKGKDPSPAGTPVTGATGTTAATTSPAGGSATTPPAPATPNPSGGSSAPKKQTSKTHHKATNRGRSNTRSPRGGSPLPSAPVTRPVRAVGPVPSATPEAPKPAAQHERSGRALARVRVSVVTRTVHDIVQVIPGPVKAAIGAMAALLLAAVAAWTFAALRGRRLRRQRGQLLQEVGLLQAALLPEVPTQIGPLAASVAYRPADGPGAGGDFYDVFQLEDGRVGLVLGDVAGHGRDALARTALLRYTLRAYLETGLEPRIALRLAGETLEHNLGSGFATAAVASYDPEAGTLTYSCAGHPPPILIGDPAHEPVTAVSAPPIGVGERTGIRQTTVALPPGSVACFFTDGLAEARVHGDLFGRERMVDLMTSLGTDLTASELIDAIREQVDHLPDDMAACVMRPLSGEAATPADSSERIEELELHNGGEGELRRFLAASGIPAIEIGDLIRSAGSRADDYDGAIVRVKISAGDRPRVSLVLPLVEMLGGGAALARR
jgi:stage II sporulation SpoE-like protein